MIDKFIKLLPVGSLIIIFLGYIKLYIYYEVIFQIETIMGNKPVLPDF